LALRELQIGVVAGTPGPDEQLGFLDLAGFPVHDINARAAVVHEGCFPADVSMMKTHIQVFDMTAVLLAEPGVSVPLGMVIPILLPE